MSEVIMQNCLIEENVLLSLCVILYNTLTGTHRLFVNKVTILQDSYKISIYNRRIHHKRYN